MSAFKHKPEQAPVTAERIKAAMPILLALFRTKERVAKYVGYDPRNHTGHRL